MDCRIGNQNFATVKYFKMVHSDDDDYYLRHNTRQANQIGIIAAIACNATVL
jgi:hypothetical protein